MATIAEKLTELRQIKESIKQAIIGKGVAAGDDMANYASNIADIPGGGSYTEGSLWGVSATITTIITHGSILGATTIDNEAILTIVPDEGYFPPRTIELAGATYTYNYETGIIYLSDPVSNVTINIICLNYEEPILETDGTLDTKHFMSITKTGTTLEVE